MYDTLIIGAGPAGLTALLFAKKYGLNVVCIGKEIGGKLLYAPHIKDYPGMQNVPGKEFVSNLLTQINEVGGVIELDEVNSIVIYQNNEGTAASYKITTKNSKSYETKTLILAVGNINKQPKEIIIKLLNTLNIPVNNGFIKSSFENEKAVLAGIFAAGDCVIYPESLEQLVTATSTGADAAAKVYEFIKKEKSPLLWGTTKIVRE